MLWKHYVFRRSNEVHDLWDSLFHKRAIRLLYIAGRGFDIRGQVTLRELVGNMRSMQRPLDKAELLLLGFQGYQLSDELQAETAQNALAMEQTFESIGGTCKNVEIGSSANGEDDISASNVLRLGIEAVLERVTDQTDIILDVSSLPRVVYLALMTSILRRLIANKNTPNPLVANGINFQILVAEDAILDAHIRSEDPSNDLVFIPGFSGALNVESMQDLPLVWFPILGENRFGQLQKVMDSIVPKVAEICPILPHPSRDPKRADRLILEYRTLLFDRGETPVTNILYAHETNPFEAYRQLLGAMRRYCDSLSIVGGCRLVVTPLASKLITLAAGLACFEMRPEDTNVNYGVAIPYAEPTRYTASIAALRASKPEISAMLLTGEAYAN